MYQNLRDFLTVLKKRGEIVTIDTLVDPHLEIAEIHRRVIAAQGPALFFTNVRGSSFPVVTNLFGTANRVSLAFGNSPQTLIANIAALPEKLIPPTPKKIWDHRNLFWQLSKIGTKIRKGEISPSVTEFKMPQPDLGKLPALVSWPEDGGPFLTLPLVHTKSIKSKPDNLGMYRVQIHNQLRAGLHFQIGKGGGFHYLEAQNANAPLPVNIYLGGPPALILSAIAPLPENVPELMLASLVIGKKLKMIHTKDWPVPFVAEAEFCITGKSPPHQRLPEGPFGDHYGYYSLQHDFPFLEVDNIFHRKDAIFPATVVGKPRQEDFFIGDYLQELLSPLFPIVMPSVKDLWSYGETGYHSLSAAVTEERHEREALSLGFRILGEGQLSLTKILFLIDKKIPLRNFKTVLQHLLERADWRSDLYIFSKTSMDTLDYSSGTLNLGSKALFLGLGEKKRNLPTQLPVFDSRIAMMKYFIPGCLVISLHEKMQNSNAETVIHDTGFSNIFANIPMVIIVDDVNKTLSTQTAFLWTVFTRFDPASDIHFKDQRVIKHHLCYEGPMFIDARLKKSFPKELFVDSETKTKVSLRWNEYFPQKNVQMGDSDYGDLFKNM